VPRSPEGLQNGSKEAPGAKKTAFIKILISVWLVLQPGINSTIA
jgi:hypothetical protein